MSYITNVDSIYLEAHVTIEPVFDDERERAGVIAMKHGFKLAKLLMQKRAEDMAERSKYDTFMTGHGVEMDDMISRMASLIEELKAANFKIWRYKIEDCIIDSRSCDNLNLLCS